MRSMMVQNERKRKRRRGRRKGRDAETRCMSMEQHRESWILAPASTTYSARFNRSMRLQMEKRRLRIHALIITYTICCLTVLDMDGKQIVASGVCGMKA